MEDNQQTLDLSNRPSHLSGIASLNSLDDLKKKLRLDSRRFAANDGLNKSMQTWIASKAPAKSAVSDMDQDPGSPPASPLLKARNSHISNQRMSLDSDCILTLQQAYSAHSAAFDSDGDGMVNVEELILIFDRCHLFDEFFTKPKVRNYYSTWANGCNQLQGSRYQLSDNVADAGISYDGFKDMLQWAADMKAESITDVVQKVVRLSRKLSGNSASAQRRLEVVFDAFCRQEPGYMSAFEFGTLAGKVDMPGEKFSLGEVYSVYFHVLGVVHGRGVDFDGFISVLTEIGKRLDIGAEVYELFAKGVEHIDTDEEMLARLKMRLTQASLIVGGSEWRQFIRAYNPNGSGYIDWDEFLVMCREKLHLADRDNHLRVLFDRLDQDGSGELEVKQLVAFLTDKEVGGPGKAFFH